MFLLLWFSKGQDCSPSQHSIDLLQSFSSYHICWRHRVFLKTRYGNTYCTRPIVCPSVPLYLRKCSSITFLRFKSTSKIRRFCLPVCMYGCLCAFYLAFGWTGRFDAIFSIAFSALFQLFFSIENGWTDLKGEKTVLKIGSTKLAKSASRE